MDTVELKKEIEKRTQQIEQILRRYLPQASGYQKLIMEAMSYSMLSGGKRLRPMLMLETYHMFGAHHTVIEPFLAAIEMIHTYSLVHDDLPAMDDDAYRRGRRTTHVVYGEAMGILAGDALLNYAFETATQAFSMGEDPARVAKAMQILAQKAGIYGMLGGQVVDVQNEGHKQIDADTLDFIYRLKTGALIASAMMIGAVLAGANEQEVSVLEQAAVRVGIAFQIQDDILDITGTAEQLGKPIGSDEKNEKSTYVTLYGMQAAQEQVEKLTNEAVDFMESLPVKNEFLTGLLLHLAGRRS
ncbi:MAG: polyprenyl synthetase family protein [Eubacterium sp.]|nr:polyprenyl synthetase family protein [Eubacterium sp.]